MSEAERPDAGAPLTPQAAANDAPWDDSEEETATDHAVLDDWIVFPVIALGVAIATLFPVFLQQELCLPLLNTLVIFPLFVWAVRSGRTRRALTMTLFWAFCLAATMLPAALLMNAQAAGAVRGLADYRTQFIGWMAGGPAVTALPAQNWLAQLRELAIFAAATALTAGLGGLFLLALAISVVSANAASLAVEATQPLLALLFGWPVWSVIRLVAFALIGVALAEPLAAGQWQPAALRTWFRRRRRLLAAGALALAAAALVQALAEPLYRSMLQASLGLG